MLVIIASHHPYLGLNYEAVLVHADLITALSQGESLEPGVAMQKVQEEAETTLGMLAFDAFPRFLKSKYSKAVMEDLKTGSNPNEVKCRSGGWIELRPMDMVDFARPGARCGRTPRTPKARDSS